MGLMAACWVLFVLSALPLRFRTRLFPKRPDLIRKGALWTLVPIGAALLLLVWHLRQQFILNEPMASAAAQGNITEVLKQLERGAWPDSEGVDAVHTALTGATAEGHQEIVSLLLDGGANPNLKNGDGKTALQIARANKNIEIEGALLKAGAKE